VRTERLRSSLGDPDVWSEFYESSPTTTEWFVAYDDLRESFRSILRDLDQSSLTALDVGCGRSGLGPSLAEDFPNLDVYCLDVSLACLKHLAERHSHAACTYVVGDARLRVPFGDGAVDLIVDKGTSDAVCRHRDGQEQLDMMLKEVSRVMSDRGTLVQVSTEVPDVRFDELKCAFEDCLVSFREIESGAGQHMLPVYLYTVKRRQ